MAPSREAMMVAWGTRESAMRISREAREEAWRKIAEKEAAKRAELDAEAERIGLDWGLGAYLGADDMSELRLRVALGAMMLGAVVLMTISLGTPMTGEVRLMAGAVVVGLLILGVMLIAIPGRTKRNWLCRYEAGMAQVIGPRPRVVVVRWDDLASLTLTVVSGHDEEYLSSYVLRSRQGRAVRAVVSKRLLTSDPIATHAESALADRLVAPLIRQLEAGQPVTIGRLTVGPSGIRSRADSERGGRWHVSWRKARHVRVRLAGQRVSVERERGHVRLAALDGVPNSFLAQYVIAHAARQAGVPVSVE
jgi:hypothetical protein